MHLFQDTVEAMSTAAVEEEILAAWRKPIREMGFDSEMCGIWSSVRESKFKGEVIAMNYSDEWQTFYADKLAASDPILSYAARQPLPFAWRDVPVNTPAQKRFLEIAAEEEGLRFGFAAQLPAGVGRVGAVALASQHDCDVSHVLGNAYAITCAMYIAVQHMRSAKARNQFSLTPREVEILKWLKDGKSKSEIATINGVSASTIKTQTERLFTKLEVNEKTLAVTKALFYGLIDL